MAKMPKIASDDSRIGRSASHRKARAGVALAAVACFLAGPAIALSSPPSANGGIHLDLNAGPDAPPASSTAPVAAPAAEAQVGRTLAAAGVIAGAAAASGAFALLLVHLMRRRNRRNAASELNGRSAAPPTDGGDAVDDAPGADLVSVSVDELAGAVRRAGIRRMLVFASSAPEFVEAATLARSVARGGSSTILVDFAYSHAAREMGIVGRVEDVLTTAASPTTFAHGINRDRMSSAHLLPVELGPIDGDREAVKEAAGAVLAALREAYDVTVAVVSSADADCLDVLSDPETAVIVPSRIGHPSAAAQTLDELAAHGVSDAVLMMVEATEQRLQAA